MRIPLFGHGYDPLDLHDWANSTKNGRRDHSLTFTEIGSREPITQSFRFSGLRLSSGDS